MKKWIVAFGTCALILALADFIHGQHNGDRHRVYIHATEFTFFFGFLILGTIQAFWLIADEFHLDGWLAGVCMSFALLAGGFILFALSGGSFHGDGGPIAFSFLLLECLGFIGMPISIIGFLTAKFIGRRNG